MNDAPHILIVDDDELIRPLAGDLLRQEFPQARIDEVDSVPSLARALEAGGFSIVVTDYRLGWTDGLTVLREVKRRYPDCPVIMFTAAGNEEIAVEAMKAGLDDYVLKSPKHVGRLTASIRMVREQAERRRLAREMDGRYRSLLDVVLESSAVGVLVLDADFRVVWTNAALARFFRLRREGLIGQDKRALIHQRIKHVMEQPDQFAQAVLATYERGASLANFECHVLAGEDRDERWLEHVSVPIRTGLYAGGRVEHYYDITGRKRAVERASCLAARLRILTEATAASVTGDEFFLSLVSGLATALQVRYAIVAGLKPGDSALVRTRAVWNGSAQAENLDYELSTSPCGQVFGQHLRYYPQGVQALFPADRLLVEMQVEGYCGAPLFDRAGTPLGILVVMDDRPLPPEAEMAPLLSIFASRAGAELEREKLEQAVREDRLRLQTFLETASDGIHILDKAGNVLLTNRAFRDMLGYTEAEAARLNVADWDARWSREELRAMLHGRDVPQRFETRHRRKDGSILDVEISAAPVEIGGETLWHAISRDITERKRTESLLLQAQERLQLALKAGNAGLWFWNVRTNETHISSTWKAQLGYADEEILDRYEEFESRLHPEDRDRVLQQTTVYIKNPSSDYEVEFRLRHKDGSYRWILTRADVYTDQEGQLTWFTGCNVDITERKRAEARLTDLLRQQDLLLASLPVAVYRAHADGNYAVTWISDSVARVTGFAPDRFTGDSDFWPARIHPEDRERLLRDLEAGISGGTYSLEYRWRCADETYHWFTDRGLVATGPDGRDREIVGIWLDISAQKRSEEALREAFDRLHGIIRASPIAMTVLDMEGRVRLWNPAARALFQWAEDEVLGRPLPTVPPERLAEHQAIRERARRGEIIYDLEAIRLRKDGTPVTIALSIVLLRDAAGTPQGLLGMMRDLTDLKRIQNEASRIERFAALGQLLGGLAHELRNPLFILTGYLQLLREKLLQREYATLPADLEKVESASARLRRIVERFLIVAKPSEPRRESCAIQTVLDQTLDFLGNELMRNRIRVETAVAPDLPPIQSDSKQLQGMFLNLMMNAMQAMAASHGRGTLTVSARAVPASADMGHGEGVTRGQGEGARWIEVRIQDDGPGILPEHRARLFEPFFSTKPPGEGTGLGLWAVRAAVIGLQGHVTYETEVGRGTTFIVRLPASEELTIQRN